MDIRPPDAETITGIHRLTTERFRRPVFDDDGLLWFGERWVAPTVLQTPVVELLLRNLDQNVPMAVIAETYGAAGGSTRDAAVLSLVRRLSQQLTAIGAKVRVPFQGQWVMVSFPPTAPLG